MESKVVVVGSRAMLGDLVELLAKALLSGIGVAIAMSLAILALCASAQAADPDDYRTAALLFPAATADAYLVAPAEGAQAGIEVIETAAATSLRGHQPWSVALTPPHAAQAASVGALWASGDSAATLHLLLGLVALMSAAMVTVIGRRNMAIADRPA